MTEPGRQTTEVVLDAKGLRALAHPLRVELVNLLRRHGPSTATRLADLLGVNSGTASYHLRRLAAAGFVEEDTERGNARDRWWRPVHQITRLTDPDLSEREPEATMAYLQSVAASYNLRLQQALNGLDTMPRDWRRVFDLSSRALRLTQEEAETLHGELMELLDRYRRDTPELAASAPEGAERLSLITLFLPDLEES
ncbi:ArsR/SmtB family transcription factor [Nonomuraea sp. LPB2021202275-12-8]|uniref:ArsR/SmtB family transcription factor n=1 Tax=Nonomuraea sp. LPB2021202275-12-8 TaxID=3120159 RepID=UPI00300C563A